MLEVRRSLEELTVRLAARRALPSQRDDMLRLAEVFRSFTGDDIRMFTPLLRKSHGLMAAGAHNAYLPVAMAPLQGLSRRFWFANLRDVAKDLREGADLHVTLLTAISRKDVDAAAEASLRLNDYLREFTMRSLQDW